MLVKIYITKNTDIINTLAPWQLLLNFDTCHLQFDVEGPSYINPSHPHASRCCQEVRMRCGWLS